MKKIIFTINARADVGDSVKFEIFDDSHHDYIKRHGVVTEIAMAADSDPCAGWTSTFYYPMFKVLPEGEKDGVWIEENDILQNYGKKAEAMNNDSNA